MRPPPAFPSRSRLITGARLFCLGLLAAAAAFGVTKEQMMDPEVRSFYDRGNAAYHGRHDREEGMRLYRELEDVSRRKQNNYWLGTAYWKQAQVLSDDGNQAGSIELFEKSLAAFNRDADFAGTANHLMLLHNLFMNYEKRGQRGESLRIHQALIPATGLNLARTSKLPADTPLFELTDEQLAAVKNMAFIGFLYETEIELRFESGDDAGALALAQKIDRRFSGTQAPREITVYASILEVLVKIHLAAGRASEAEAVLRRMLALAEIPKTEAYDEILTARIDLALLRCRLGESPAPWIDYVRKAIEETSVRRWTHRRLSGVGKLARILAISGDTPAALTTINEAVGEARALDEPLLLAELLLTRAELRLDAGYADGVLADLFETLKWYRLQGGLRDEASAFVQYVRLLRLNGDPADMHLALSRAETCLRRFPDARQTAFLSPGPTDPTGASARTPAILPATPIIRPPATAAVPKPAPEPAPAQPADALRPGRPSICDLQPVELTTRVAAEWSAKGRFTLTNPDKALVEGLLQANGAGLSATWDEALLQWDIRVDAKGSPNRVEQRVSLKPYDQAIVLITADAADGGVQLTWRDEGDKQSSWWRFTRGLDPSNLSVIGANLALENPFYSVPLHHYIVRPDPDAGTSQNLRVITSTPCRVEIVDAVTGKVLAIDAGGDGDFKGVGDVIIADGNLDGTPDIRFDKGQRVAEVEIQIYPASAVAEVSVYLELQKRDGTWMRSSTDRLLGKQ